MHLEKIRTGKLSEKEFIDIFGTDINIKRFEATGTLKKPTMDSLLKKAKLYCHIVKQNSRSVFRVEPSYLITKIYSDLTTSVRSTDHLKEGFQKMISVPLLDWIINSQKEYLDIESKPFLLYQLGFYNSNYIVTKNEEIKETIEAYLQIPYDIFLEMYRRSDSRMLYWLDQTFRTLQSLELLHYKSIGVGKQTQLILSDINLVACKKIRTKISTMKNDTFLNNSIQYLTQKNITCDLEYFDEHPDYLPVSREDFHEVLKKFYNFMFEKEPELELISFDDLFELF